jgi:hypothetical protein
MLSYKIINKKSGWHQRCTSRVAILNVIKKHNSRKEMSDIIANNIFHKKASVKACQPSRQKIFRAIYPSCIYAIHLNYQA